MTKKQISYSEAISEIEDTLASIERGDLDVDVLADKVKRVSGLIKMCKSKLQQTEKEVEDILNDMEE